MAILDRLPKIANAPWREDEPSTRPEPAATGEHEAKPLGTLLPRDGLATPVGAFTPSLDLEETEDAYRLHVELPDVRPEDVEVSVDRRTLTISGQRRFYDEQGSDRFRRVERSFGRFHRVLRLPDGADPDGVEATHRDGLLEVHVPKREEARARRIPVRQSS